MAALIGGAIATVLSLCVFSRVFAPNPAYRFAQSLLVGTALGYAAALLLRSTVVPAAQAIAFGQASPLDTGVSVAGLLLGSLVLVRYGRQRGSHWANYPLAILFGIGAALALVGALRGTLVPQMIVTVRSAGALNPNMRLDDLLGIAMSVVLTLITLASFSYIAKRRPAESGAIMPPRALLRGVHSVGRVLVLAAFGVFFAAAVRTYLAALVGQVAMINEWASLVWTWIGGP
jgi:hypothetical protein